MKNDEYKCVHYNTQSHVNWNNAATKCKHANQPISFQSPLSPRNAYIERTILATTCVNKGASVYEYLSVRSCDSVRLCVCVWFCVWALKCLRYAQYNIHDLKLIKYHGIFFVANIVWPPRCQNDTSTSPNSIIITTIIKQYHPNRQQQQHHYQVMSCAPRAPCHRLTRV